MLKANYYLLIFTLGITIRILFFLLYFQYNPLMTSFDSKHYHELALSLANGKGYSDAQENPYFYRLPGYPLFLAACYKFFNNSPINALLIQAILSMLIPLLLFFLSSLLFPQQKIIQLCATFLAALHPGYIIYSGLMMSETIFVILFLLFTYFFFKLLIQQASWLVLPCGLFLGMASLVRPVGHLLLPFIIFLTIFTAHSFKKKLAHSCLLFFSWLMPVSFWLIRNYQLTGMLFFHTLTGPHFLNHCGIKLLMKQEGISYLEAQAQAYQEINKLIAQKKILLHRPLEKIEEATIMEAYTKKLMHKNSLATLTLFTINWVKTIFGLYSSELLVIESGGQLPSYDSESSLPKKLYRFLVPTASQPIKFFIYYEILFFIMILIGSFLGLWRIAKYNLLLTIVTMIFIASFIFLSLGCGFARMRLPIEHFFIMLTSVFLKAMFSKKG